MVIMYNDFEKIPNSAETSGERYLPPEQDFEKAFAEGVPEFAGVQFGVKKDESNEYYGDLTDEEVEQVAPEEAQPEQVQPEQAAPANGGPENTQLTNTGPEGANYDKNLTDASAIIGYGFDAVARQNGVEAVAEKIKYFDESSSNNPVGDLYKEMDIDTPEEMKQISDESRATKDKREELIKENNMPEVKERNDENARQAIRDMKDVITEVENANPKYEELRQGALKAGKGEFDYAVEDQKTQGLTEAFSVLSEQKERSNEEETPPEAPPEIPPDGQERIYAIDDQENIELINQKRFNQ